MPQSSVLRPILFNIFLSGLTGVLNDTDIASDADDITLACKNAGAAVKTLKMPGKKLFQLLKDNQMKDNTGNCYLILNTRDSNQIQID